MNEDVIEKAWPYDGPHSSESIISAAQGVAELVRYLNNATRTPARLPYMGDVDAVLGQLSTAFDRLPQLVTQMCAVVEQHWNSTDVYDDQGGDVQDLLGDCVATLQDFGTDLVAPTVTLKDARSMAAQIGHRS